MILTFFLTIFGTFMTRSGVVQSVHAFGEDRALAWMFIVFMVLILTFSFGLVTFDSAPQSVNHLVKLADSVMYEVKNSGKDGVKCSIYSAPPVGDLAEK